MSIIYILTNEAMPGLIKIGMTDGSVEKRMRELDTSGIPLPFKCFYAARVTDSRRAEKLMHTAFRKARVRDTREFFEMDAEAARAALMLGALEDVTPKSDVVSDKADIEALQRSAKRAPRFSFSQAGIPLGATLVFERDPSVTAIVAGDRTILFQGVETSLSDAALRAFRALGYNWSQVQGPQYWLYEDESLTARRARLEADATGSEGDAADAAEPDAAPATSNVVALPGA